MLEHERSLLHRLTGQLLAEFKKSGRFAEVLAVRSYDRRRRALVAAPAQVPDENVVTVVTDAFRAADSLDAPMRPASDMAEMDRERDAAPVTSVHFCR